MAAATVASTTRPHVEGDRRIFERAYTALANTNTDTWPAGTNIAGVRILKASTSAAVTATVAANVITFNVSAGTPDVTVEVLMGPS